MAHRSSTWGQVSGLAAAVFERGEIHKGVLVRLLYIHRNNGVVIVSFRNKGYSRRNSSLFRHFWHVVVALALEGPPIVGPRYLFMALRDLDAPTQRICGIWILEGKSNQKKKYARTWIRGVDTRSNARRLPERMSKLSGAGE